jgi:hypothetical protein
MLDSKRYNALLDANTGVQLMAKLAAERDIITVLVLMVIFGSFLYYACVVMSEVFGVLPQCIAELLVSKRDTELAKNVNEMYEVKEEDDIEFQSNPYMNQSNITTAQQLIELTELKAGKKATDDEKAMLVEQVEKMAELRKKDAKNKGNNARSRKKKGGKGKGGRGKRRKDFGAKAVSGGGSADHLGVELFTDAGESVAVAMANPMSGALENEKGVWKSHQDSDGYTYYEEPGTGRTTWTDRNRKQLLKSNTTDDRVL